MGMEVLRAREVKLRRENDRVDPRPAPVWRSAVPRENFCQCPLCDEVGHVHAVLGET